MLRADLDYTFGGMATEESPIDWLDRVHPVRYGYATTPPPSSQRVYAWGVNLAGWGEQAERFDRCPTCEQWSPCTVRTHLLPLIRASREDTVMRHPILEVTPERKRHLFLRLGPGLFYAEKDGGAVLRHAVSWRKIAGFWMNTPWGCYWLRLRRFGRKDGPS